MNKKLSFILVALAFSVVLFSDCNNPAPEPEPETIPDPVDLVDLKSSVPVTEDWVFSDKPRLTIHVENPNEVEVEANAKMRITTDLKKEVTTVEKTVKVPAKGKVDIDMTTDGNLDPGFYRAICSVDGRLSRNFFFGISPTKIVSAPDKQDDFDAFWEDGKKQLEAIDMKAELTEITSKSSAARKVYLVEMQSVPDGLTGDPVIIRGYYCEPQDGQKHKVLLHFYGYDEQNSKSKIYCPAGGSSTDYAEFYLSHRGQYLNNRPASSREPDGKGDIVNPYGDWFAFNFGDKDCYYYRGAFLDCVQAIRFLATRPTSDMNNLFAEGSSQGGALTYAAAALSDYPFAAIAPCVAFLGDFPDYFKIVSWPGDTAKKKQKEAGLSDEEMYRFLSYFDTKNLATRISCPVIASVCLQDGTCPPHTNIAPYNNLLSTDKEVYFYPELQHEIPSNWPSKYSAFFKARVR